MADAPPLSRRYITISEAAEYLAVTDRTVRQMIADGRLRGYRSGTRLVRLRRDESTAPCTRSVVPHDRRRRVAADATMPGHRGPGTRDSRHTV
ncbi:phiRv2 prophage protein [Mycobacterium tuberculosis]|nr:phiRv2 prophage protein [Mycobacterium tuberculosis]